MLGQGEHPLRNAVNDTFMGGDEERDIGREQIITLQRSVHQRGDQIVRWFSLFATTGHHTLKQGKEVFNRLVCAAQLFWRGSRVKDLVEGRGPRTQLRKID